MSENSESKQAKQRSEVILLIPAYNEADSIERVVNELIEHYPELDYVVICDGPTDGTDEICRRNGYNAIFMEQNMGLTAAFHNGMVYAAEKRYKYAVQVDGDGQHRPEYIKSMIEMADKDYDIVMGSRFIGLENRISGLRNIGSKLIKAAIKYKTGVTVTDPTCGLRLYNRKVIKMFANHSELAPEPDTIARLIKSGARIAEVPVRVADREAGESYLSPVKAVKYMWHTLRAILSGRKK